MNAHPRIRGSLPLFPFFFGSESELGICKSSNHLRSLPLIPSKPGPPRAMVGGKASGIEAAEKKVMESVGIGGSFGGGRRRTPVASENFSGIDKSVGILYLGPTVDQLTLLQRTSKNSLTNPASEQGYPYIARKILLSGCQAKL